MENSSGGRKLFVRKVKYGNFECGLNDYKISTLGGISLKMCVLAKSKTVFPFLEFIKPESRH